jgi:hypothetical protein
MKGSAKPKAPATGQRSIAAFFKPSAGAGQQKRAAPLTASPKDGGPSTAATEQAEDVPAHVEEVAGPPAKKSRQAYLVPSGSPHKDSHPPSSGTAAATGTSAAAPDVEEYIIPNRDARRHARAQAKLARPEVYDPAAATAAAAPVPPAAGPSTGAGRGKKAAGGAVKYTPLEEQVCI